MQTQDFWTIFLSIIIEAFPFVVLGVAVSIILTLYFRSEWIAKVLSRNIFLSHLQMTFLGAFFPVCECGNVPLARGLIRKGFRTSHAIAFLLAAPIINPLTFVSTWQAFSFNKSVVTLRMLGTLVIALSISLIVAWMLKGKGESHLHKDFAATCEVHDHGSTMSQLLEIFDREFFSVMKLLVIGAAIASFAQVAIPRSTLAIVGQHPVYSIAALLLLGFIIAVCSSVDAFIALSFINTFTLGSIIAFLIFGPMMDIRMLTILRKTFAPRLLAFLFASVLGASFAIGLLVNYFLI